MNALKVITRFMISIFISILMFIGVTFAFFVAKVYDNESESTVNIASGVMRINYSDGSGSITLSNVMPGASIVKSFTLCGNNDIDVSNNNSITNSYMSYRVGLSIDKNTFSSGAITYSLEYDDANSNKNDADVVISDAVTGSILVKSGVYYMGSGHFTVTSNQVCHAYKLTISFPETGEDQSIDQGKVFAAHIVIGDVNKYAADIIADLYETSEGKNYLRYDTTDDQNLRYYGSGSNVDDVPNYILFNEELWRIIGVFSVYNADTNEYERSLKIIRNNFLGAESTYDNVSSNIGTSYSWDSSSSSVNSGYGINAWRQAKLMTELNNDYLESSENKQWYSDSDEVQNATYDYTQGIKSKYKNYILNTVWGITGYSSYQLSALEMYNYERSGIVTVTGKTCSGTVCDDGVVRRKTWTGLIGLPYPSDYGFAAMDNGSSNCSSNMYSSANCKKKYNWMIKGNIYEWTMTQYVGLSFASGVYVMRSSGQLYFAQAYEDFGVRPTLYLKSNVQIVAGSGLSSEPYVIQL